MGNYEYKMQHIPFSQSELAPILRCSKIPKICPTDDYLADVKPRTD